MRDSHKQPWLAARFGFVTLLLVLGMTATLALAPAADASFEITSFSAELVDSAGNPATQAGSHPDLVTDFRVNTTIDPHSGEPIPEEAVKDMEIKLPPGFYGNPSAVGECPASLFRESFGTACTLASQVGFAEVQIGPDPTVFFAGYWPTPVYNMVPEPGETATLGMAVFGTTIKLGVSVRTDGDYGITTKIENSNQALPVYGAHVTLWGVPGDPAHDAQRWEGFLNGGHASGAARKPFLTAPTNCDTPWVAEIRARSWQSPDNWVTAEDQQPPLVGCDALAFNPHLRLEPRTKTADTPSGYDVEVEVPQSEEVTTPATALLRNGVVTLPQGVAINPASAQGLEACSDSHLALGTQAEPSCPQGSKIGTVKIDTPLLSDPLEGEIILGTPKPGELFRLFLVARGPGLVLKIPGTAHPDPTTGQLRAVFDETPALPFSKLSLHFKGGSRAVLVTPDTCGTKVATSEMTPTAGPTVEPSASFDISSCPNGFSPTLEAGTKDPVAGAPSPFELRVARKDGEQKLGSIDLTLPPGQLAKLRGVPYCPEATLAGISGNEGAAAVEAASPSCPAASQVGSVQAGAGAGTPFFVSGKAYLAGPYEGAPLSLAFVTPALAGPFDLGNVVVRSALRIDPVTAQVEAVSDPLPTILHGVPLDLKDVRVSLDRPDFTVNPTSCEEMHVSGQVVSSAGTLAGVDNRYQLGDCAALGFKPKLSLKFSGATHRSAHPAVRAVLKARKGDANIGRAVVTLPETEFLENAHLNNVCTRVRYAADNCPKDSIYGYAKAWSPLLDKPLRGPVYLRSSNHELPDLVASLDGQIHLDLAAKIDSVNERMRTTFWSVPDAPVSKFVLTMQGGDKGLLVNNEELCRAKPRVRAEFTGQNGKRSVSNPLVKVGCGKSGKH